MTNENKQQERLREIDELLFECQRHNIPAISVTYAQLKALRAVTKDTTPKMQAFAPMEEMARLRAELAELRARAVPDVDASFIVCCLEDYRNRLQSEEIKHGAINIEYLKSQITTMLLAQGD